VPRSVASSAGKAVRLRPSKEISVRRAIVLDEIPEIGIPFSGDSNSPGLRAEAGGRFGGPAAIARMRSGFPVIREARGRESCRILISRPGAPARIVGRQLTGPRLQPVRR